MTRPPPSPARRRGAGSSTHPALIGLMLALAFAIGRLSAPEPERTACPGPEPITEPMVIETRTSTLGLCPCPRPRPPARSGGARRPDLRLPGTWVPPDPSAETARFLRERAQTFGDCAPASGATLRVHLQITVSPAGAVSDVRVLNLDGEVPTPVTECLVARARALEPPGFDGVEPLAFTITVGL